MNADSRDGRAMAQRVSGAPRECRRCGESETLQDNQARDNRRDDNTRRLVWRCPVEGHVTFDSSSMGRRQRA